MKIRTEDLIPGNPRGLFCFTATGMRLVAIDGTGQIKGHGDITTPVTAWALLNQVME